MNDRYSQRLSLLLVFIVLVFIYPLRMVFGSFFQFVSGGWLPAQVHLQSVEDVRLMFVVFALGFGAMGGCMALLYRRAWERREALALDPLECLATRYSLLRWLMLPAVSVLSMALSAVLLRGDLRSNLLMSLPGLVFFGLNIMQRVFDLKLRRARKALAKAGTKAAEEN